MPDRRRSDQVCLPNLCHQGLSVAECCQCRHRWGICSCCWSPSIHTYRIMLFCVFCHNMASFSWCANMLILTYKMPLPSPVLASSNLTVITSKSLPWSWNTSKAPHPYQKATYMPSSGGWMPLFLCILTCIVTPGEFSVWTKAKSTASPLVRC